jgi:2-oxo-4-hydroxy-4-carboxy-5-ureidoimidazoline decarboxylase
MGTDQLTWFNQLPARAAQQTLLDCCSAPGWAAQMTAGRPYSAAEDVIERSSAIVAALSAADLAEALAGHPRIGERPDSPGDSASQKRGNQDGASQDAASQQGASQQGAAAAVNWSRQEQSGVEAGDTATTRALAAGNLEYEQRFGHIYLVCASGRTGQELLALLHGRLGNKPEDEWQVVRTELQKINALRLQRLLAGAP